MLLNSWLKCLTSWKSCDFKPDLFGFVSARDYYLIYFHSYLISFVVQVYVRSMNSWLGSILRKERLAKLRKKKEVEPTYRRPIASDCARAIRLIQANNGVTVSIVLVIHASRCVQRCRANWLRQFRSLAFKLSLVLRDQHNAETAQCIFTCDRRSPRLFVSFVSGCSDDKHICCTPASVIKTNVLL